MKFIKIAAMFAFLAGFQANANTITIELDNNVVNVGDVINVNLLADFTDAVDTFNFDFIFDNSLFALVDGSVGSDLPNDGFDSFFDVVSNPTGLGIGFFSVVDFAFDNFTLASFQLTALRVGTNDFSMESLLLSNESLGETYELDPVVTATAAIVEAPAPATLGLFAVALFGLVGLRRKA